MYFQKAEESYCCPVTKMCLTLWDSMDYSIPGFPVLRHLLEFAQTHVHWVSDTIQPFHPVIPCSSCPQSFPVSVFSSESALRIRWPKYWSFSFSICPSNEYSGLISFRNDWFDLPAVQGTLKSLPQHHNSKASILRHSAFFMVQLSHLYMTSGKTIALTILTFVGKMMSLLLMHCLKRFVVAFFSKEQVSLISWQ